MNIIIAGGGTGGHLYPGIAVAEEFWHRMLDMAEQKTEFNTDRESLSNKQKSNDKIVFVGTKHGIESRIIPKEGYRIKFLRAEGFIGKSFFKKLKAAVTFVLSIFDSFKIIRSVRPNIVIGVGGYASAGMVFAAHFKGIPTMILEQNSIPGFANKFLSRFADAVAVTYQESISFFPSDKTYLTGNPVRKQILRRLAPECPSITTPRQRISGAGLQGRLNQGDEKEAYSIFPLKRGKFTVFIFGGSSGASSINYAAIEALNYLLDLRQNIQFLHQTGEKDYEKVKGSYRRLGFEGIVVPFIYKMAEAYIISDIVVSRAGATTLAEITAVGKPVILIPFPYAAFNHQEYNARKLQDMGAARMILDRELNGETLAGMIRELYSNEKMRNDMQKAVSAFCKIDAAEKVVDIAMSLIKNKAPEHRNSATVRQ